MKAIVQTRYGSAEDLEVREVPKPTPGEGEVLVRVRASTVHPDVWHVVTGFPYVLRLMGAGVLKPENPVPGTDLAGRVEAVGPGVTRLKVGDEVFGESTLGHQWSNGGAYAEYAAVPERALALKPPGVSFEEAASVATAGLIALSGLRGQGRLEAGQRVLINGAAGGVGAVAVQLAKAFGAEVTGVDHADKLELVRSLGADRVIDYTREDFTQGEARYDLIFDVPGNHPFSEVRRALTPQGVYVLIGHDHYGRAGHRWLGSLPRMFGLMARSRFNAHLPEANFTAPDKQAALETLQGFLADGKLTPVIDRTYPLEQAGEALRYLQGGNAHGKIVLTVDGA